MLMRACVLTILLGLAAAPAFAQAEGEVAASVGWTFSDGVTFTGTPVNGVTYSRVDPKDSLSYSLSGGVYVNHELELEFLWNHQPTKAEVTGGVPTISGNMNVDNYHGNIVIHAGGRDAPVRPFFYIGAGATNYGEAAFPNRTIPGLTRFSWAIGAGAKVFPSPHAGFKFAVRWVPTYIKTDAAGWWCDPFWGCAPAGNVQYANQFELSGGVVFKFGQLP